MRNNHIKQIQKPVRMQNNNCKMEKIMNNKPVGAVREPPAEEKI